MAATQQVLVGPSAGEPESRGNIRYVARQPIIDLHGRVHAYELLFRNGPDAEFSGNGEHATRTMIDNTVVFGLARLTGGLPAFINCTENSLHVDLIHILPASMTVLEVLESIKPSAGVIEACRDLKAYGYRLALDDFTWQPGIEPLVELADYVKVDFCLTSREERRELLARLRPSTVALIAEKVETQEQFEEARKEGFTLVQGYYFCRPALLANYIVPANRLSQVEILALLQNETIDLQKVAEQVSHDPSLTLRLLRLANSPIWAYRDEVHSVHEALIVIGERNFRRLATVAIASELNSGQSPELLRMTLVRARFCELAAKICSLNPTEQYLLGMLSLLPAMLRVPMREITSFLPLRTEICQALEGANLREGFLLNWLENHEVANWEACDALTSANGCSGNNLVRCFTESLQWVENILLFA